MCQSSTAPIASLNSAHALRNTASARGAQPGTDPAHAEGMAKRRTRRRLDRMKRSFVVTLSAAGASGLIGAGCAGSALGGLKDADDGDQTPGAPVAGTWSPPTTVPTSNPPFVNPTEKPQPPPMPQPRPAGSGGSYVHTAGAGGPTTNPPSPCAVIPTHGTACSYQVTCEFPQTAPCVPGKHAVCAANTWFVTDVYSSPCNPPPPRPDEDAGTSFD